MDDVADFENIGEQFRFLLQPVRDLAKNWDIDITHYLEDYLKKLAQEWDNELDAQGKRKIFNFAEAAVVIDGSTNIYCRKVDYLLQQALDCLAEISVSNEKKKKRKGPNENADPNTEGDGDGDADGGGDDDEDEDPDERRRHKNPYLKPLDDSTMEQMRSQLQKLSKKRAYFPIVPLAFTPLNEFEKCEVVLQQRTANRGYEVVGKKDDFKANTCEIIDGVALIDLKNADLLEMFSQSFHSPTASDSSLRDSLGGESVCTQVNTTATTMITVLPDGQPAFDAAFPNPTAAVVGDGGDNDDAMDVDCDDTVSRASISTNAINFFDNLNMGDMDMDGDNSLMDYNRPDGEQHQSPARREINSLDANFRPEQRPASTNSQVPTQTSDEVSVSSAVPATNSERPPEGRVGRNTRLAATLEEPFQPLNPLEERTSRSKPFKLDTRCTTNVDRQLKQRDRRIEKECKAKNVPNISTVKNFIDTRVFAQRVRRKAYVFAPFNSLLMDGALLALNAQAHAERERRAALRRRRGETGKMERRLARRTSQRTSIVAADHRYSLARGSTTFGVVSQMTHSPPRFEDPIEELANDDLLDDYEIPNLSDPHANDRPLGDLLETEHLGEQSFFAPDFDEDLNRSRRRSELIRSDNIYDDTIYAGPGVEYPDNLPPRPISQMEYNDLVEYHLKKYWTIKEEATTKFAARVRDWESKVNPLLNKELDQEAFNARTYSTRLIESFKNGVGSDIDFAQFAKSADGGENYNLSRYLLISLILTNMQNVEIVSADINCLKLRLKKLERHDELFDDEQRLITGGGAAD